MRFKSPFTLSCGFAILKQRIIHAVHTDKTNFNMVVLDMLPQDLPVYKQRDKILNALADNQVVVVESPTGSGKTTQIPQILLQAGYAHGLTIGVTQPRRIAAVSVAEFIAGQLGVTIPHTVGYKMRFEDQTSEATRIKIMTDGILLQEIKMDYALSRYGVLMVDEAHERSLNIDFILGLLKKVLEERPKFKVIVSSATINAEIFSEYFDECPVVKIDSAAYPVKIIYDPPSPENSFEEMLKKTADIVERLHRNGKDGDVLIFLPGEGAIKSCMEALQALPVSRTLKILPLYSRLSTGEQERIFLDYPGKSKIIVATNIAETSVTIDGIICVIDSGLAKMNFYNPRNFTSSLIEIPVSRASSNQRKGRAGRTRPGLCYRLYSREDYNARSLFSLEEIHRTDLSEVVLRMAELGIKDFERFDFLSPPGKEGIISAIETLGLLDALDENRELTTLGRQMINFPIIPRISRLIMEALLCYPQVLEEVLVAAAFLSTKSPFLLPPGEELQARKAHHSFRDSMGDFVSYLKIYRSFLGSRNREQYCGLNFLDLKIMNEIHNIKLQLEDIVSDMGIPITSGGQPADYLCAIARGLIQFVCARSGRGTYKSLTAGQIQIHPGSVMYRESPLYIVAGEIIRTSRMYARSVSPLKKEWLKKISPAVYQDLVLKGVHLKRRKDRRDFTKHIKIGREEFKIELEKGNRKTVLLPWARIRALMEKTDWALLPDYKNLKGKILYRDYEILSGVRLKTILYLVTKINPEQGIIERVSGATFSFRLNGSGLTKEIKNLLRMCRLNKNSRKLGFVALYTDGSGNYWFKGIRSFSTALSESLASLENLADEPEGRLKSSERRQINELYRKLSELVDQI
ncbi:ATP-dependent RNA helicase HrpA [subsurface metagenome]